MTEAEIDETLAGSFPASDRPSWTLGTERRAVTSMAMKNKLNATKNDLSEQTRRKVIDLLNQNLADVLDRHLQAKQAHWNVKELSFFSLHELFDKVAQELEGFADEIAERAVALGGVALGTVRVAAKSSRLSEYPLDISAGSKHVERTVGLRKVRPGGDRYGSASKRRRYVRFVHRSVARNRQAALVRGSACLIAQDVWRVRHQFRLPGFVLHPGGVRSQFSESWS